MALEWLVINAGLSLPEGFLAYLPSLDYLHDVQASAFSLSAYISPAIKASLFILGVVASLINASVIPSSWGGPGNAVLEVQAHRGGLGHRTENSLWAFAHAMVGIPFHQNDIPPARLFIDYDGQEMGVSILEMDAVFTKDGVPVVWHDHDISPEKCWGDFVGAFIVNLTLAEVKSLSCDVQLAEHPQAKIYQDARIPTLEEVLDLIECYDNKMVTINLETKLDPLAPNETLPVEKYIDDIVPLLERRGFASRTTIQSFDWRTLIGIKKKFPKTVIVALVELETLTPVNGEYPWLGGLNLADFNNDWIAAAASIGAEIVSPGHGFPWTDTIHTPGYEPFVNEDMVKRAHELNMRIIPWTADDEATIAKLIDDGVDGIMSNYPQRVMWVGREKNRYVPRVETKHRPHCLVNA